jgi:outer membrane protein TolC
MLFFAVTANAQETPKQSYSFSLDQAISHALANNYSAINASRDIDIAKQKKRETTATGLPQINGAVDYTNNIEIPLTPLPASVIDPNAPADEFTAIAFSPKQSVNARATLSQLLFDGSYIVALQASKTYLKYYQNAKQKTDVEIREMVTNAYGNVLLAEESILILEKNKTILEKTLGDTRETFKNGLIEEENVEQLEITLGTVNSNLNNTKRVLNIAYRMLKISLGIDIDADLKLTDKLDNLTTSNLDAAISQGAFNVNGNIDYQIAQNFTEQRTLELKLQKSKALPSLSANATFGYNAFDAEFRFLNSNMKYYNYSNIGASLNVPIFSGFARSARTQQAKIALDQAKTQLTETEQRLKLAYESAKSDYEFSIEEYATAKNNLSLAERIEKKQQIKFTEGLSSSFDFSEAQRQLYTAQQDYLQSMAGIVNKKAALEKITNGK